MPSDEQNNSKQSKRFNLLISQDELNSVEEWRRKQNKIPSMSKAIRFLIGVGLRSEDKKKDE